MADVLSGLVTILPFRIPFFFFLHSLGFTKTTPTPSPLFFSRLSSSLSVKTIDCQFIESTPVRGDRWFLSITISPFLSLSEVVQLISVPGKGNQIGTAFPREEWLFGFNEGGGAPLRRETSTTTASRSWKAVGNKNNSRDARQWHLCRLLTSCYTWSSRNEPFLSNRILLLTPVFGGYVCEHFYTMQRIV